LAAALGTLAELLTNQSRKVEAESVYQESLSLWKSLTADYPDRLNYRQALVACRCGLAGLLGSSGKSAQAEQHFREAVSVAERLAADYPRVPDFALSTASIRTRLAQQLRSRGEGPRAETMLREALEQLNILSAAEPQKPSLKAELAACELELGASLQDRKDSKNAEVFYCSAAVHSEAALAVVEGSPEFAWLRARVASRLADLLLETGRRPEASAACAQSLAIKNRIAAAHPQIAGYQADLAWELIDCRDPSQRDAPRAVELAIRATELRPHDAAAWRVRGAALYRVGRWQEAVAALERSRQLEKIDETLTCYYLAMGYQRLGEASRADKALSSGELAFAKQFRHDRTLKDLREEAKQTLSHLTSLPADETRAAERIQQ
jgi:tetratricopeptide (TPR) repeat protein